MPQPIAPLDAASPPSPAAPPTPRTPSNTRRIESRALFDGEIEIEIEHLAQVYRLRQTSLGKLILTK